MAIQRFIYSRVALTLGVSIWENRSWTRINVCSGSIPLPYYPEIEHQKLWYEFFFFFPSSGKVMQGFSSSSVRTKIDVIAVINSIGTIPGSIWSSSLIFLIIYFPFLYEEDLMSYALVLKKLKINHAYPTRLFWTRLIHLPKYYCYFKICRVCYFNSMDMEVRDRILKVILIWLAEIFKPHKLMDEMFI